MGRPPKADAEDLHIRVGTAHIQRLESLVASFRCRFGRSNVARRALELGMDAIARDPKLMAVDT